MLRSRPRPPGLPFRPVDPLRRRHPRRRIVPAPPPTPGDRWTQPTAGAPEAGHPITAARPTAPPFTWSSEGGRGNGSGPEELLGKPTDRLQCVRRPPPRLDEHPVDTGVDAPLDSGRIGRRCRKGDLGAPGPPRPLAQLGQEGHLGRYLVHGVVHRDPAVPDGGCPAEGGRPVAAYVQRGPGSLDRLG